MNFFEEVQYIRSKNNINIYGLTKINHNEQIKSLYASKNCIHILNANNPLDPPIQWKEEFTHTIDDAFDIISVNSYHEYDNAKSIYRCLIAVTYIGKSINEEGKEILKDNDYHMNVYGINSSYKDSLSDIFSDCIQFNLTAVPFILTNFNVQILQQRCFFLSLADNTVHIYGRDSNGEFCEIFDIRSYILPQTFSSTTISIDSFILNENTQGFVFGQQNGTVTLLIYNHQDRSKKLYNTVLDGPISFVKFYHNQWNENSSVHPYFQNLKDKLSLFNNQQSFIDSESSYHIIVGGAIGYAILFKNVFKDGLSDSSILPESDKYDSILCCSIIFNVITGRNTILIGTYGKKILAYEEKSYLFQTSKKIEDQSEISNIESETEYKLSLGDRSKENDSLTGSSVESGTDVFHKIKKIRNEENIKYILGNTSLGTSPDEEISRPSNITQERFIKSKNTIPNNKPFNERSPSFSSKSSFTLSWSFSLCDPVYGIISGDFLNEEVESFIVTTSFGIHLFRVNQTWLKEKIRKKLKLIKLINEGLVNMDKKETSNNEDIKEKEYSYEEERSVYEHRFELDEV